MNPDPKSSIRKRYIWVVVAVVLVVILLRFALVRRSPADSGDESAKEGVATVTVAPVAVRSMDNVVTAQGILVPSQGGSVKIAPLAAGRLVSVRVREGDIVSAGEIVAVLDNRVPLAEAQSASSALRQSRMQAEQSAMSAKAAASDYSGAVQSATIELEITRNELKKMEAGARPQEIGQAEQAVKQAQATRDRAATEVDRVKFLCDKGVDSKRQLEDAQTALSVADSALASARDQASLVRAGSPPEDLRNARLKVRSAETALRQARQGSLQVAAKRQESQAAAESVRQKAADLAAAQANVAYSELRSPIPGKVTHRFLNPGDMADTASSVVEIANTRSLNLTANIPAEDGQTIHRGMSAHVILVTSPGRVFPGGVIDVGEVDPQSGMMSVRIAVIGNSSALKVGAFATADIVIRTNPLARVVPKSAVITRNGHPVVFVAEGDTARQVNVTIGPEQDDVVEISSGLKPGDKVITMGQYELSDGTKIRLADEMPGVRR